MQNKEVMRLLIEPLLTEARELLATEPGIEERASVLIRLARAEAAIGQPDREHRHRRQARALAFSPRSLRLREGEMVKNVEE